MYRNKTATQKNFATVPRSDIPRSKFRMRQTRKQAFNASELIPVMCEEVLPGDAWSHEENIVARFATPIAPAVDDINLETFYFFVPNRITWDEKQWEEFISGIGEVQRVIPRITPLNTEEPPERVIPVNSLFDHFGIPPGDYTRATPPGPFLFNVLPIWAYFRIYNEWFRDQNLQPEWYWLPGWTDDVSSAIMQAGDDTPWNMQCLRINKVHDYFTSSLPWPQKGDPVTMPLGTTAPVVPEELGVSAPNFVDGMVSGITLVGSATAATEWSVPVGDGVTPTWGSSGLVADLSAATAATINALRLAAQTQKLLEQDARGGSRYVEQILVHFGVRSPDYRLDRPEYLGGSKIPVNVNPVAQTAAYDAEPGDTASAVGNLGAEMHASGSKRTFNYGATEHGYIIGLAAVRSTPTYQQGIRRHWVGRNTRLDYYFPVFANLGEQAVATEEIYLAGDGIYENPTWGYQERNAEYRYTPNEITGVMRSQTAQPMDWWHYAEEFENEPALNGEFIEDKTQETLARSLATAPSAQWSAQIIMDILHDSTVARLMPAYGVPGIDRF